MKPAKLPTPSFYPLSDLAAIWGCSEALVSVYAEIGTDSGDKLAITSFSVGKKKVMGVTVEEKERFESGRSDSGAPAETINQSKKKTLDLMVGILSITWAGGDPVLVDHPYTFLALLEKAAAACGVPILRGDDTNARVIQEGIEAVCAQGYKRKASGE